MNTLKTRKIILVIVEGPSDETALGAVLDAVFKSEIVRIDVVHGDITADYQSSLNNILPKIGMRVKGYCEMEHLKKADIARVIHIIDTDGTFVPRDCIKENTSLSSTRYSADGIETNSVERIYNRNKRKSVILSKLCTVHSVLNNIPYDIYYMSCNLDHVLYNKQNNSREGKESDSYTFADKYSSTPRDFINFISNSAFSVPGDFRSTWEFIKKDKNSLKRYTNLALALPQVN